MESSLLFIKEPEKRVKTLIKKLTHSGETDLDKDSLKQLKVICKTINNDDIIVISFKECIKSLQKEHSQVRVTTTKLIDYLFRKSHIFRVKLLDDFDTFLELTLAITSTPKVKLNLPPPKKYGALLQESAAKLIHTWHCDFGAGYEKLRYAYKFLKEHNLVDFSQFRVQTHEDLIKKQKLVEQQEKLLTRLIQNRIDELLELRPEVEQILVQIESLFQLLLPKPDDFTENGFIEYQDEDNTQTNPSFISNQQHHGVANLSHSIQIKFSPYREIRKTKDNEGIIQNLKELKSQLVEVKLRKLINIERTLMKRSDKFIESLRTIIDLKNKSTNIIMKFAELEIVEEINAESNKRKHPTTLDNDDSDSDDYTEFEEVEPKEDLESYIPKSMRHEYGLEVVPPNESIGSSHKLTQTQDISFLQPSSSNSLTLPCNARLESGKLCSRRDKFKCPFHGPIIPRGIDGVPINEEDRLRDEKMLKSKVPEWQDPDLLADIRRATGIDLTMRPKSNKDSKLVNTKTCDLTPKQRLEKKLKLLNK